MFEALFELAYYIMFFGEGFGGILVIILALAGIGAIHTVMPIVTVVLLIAEVIISIVGISHRVQEGIGVAKSIFSSIVCLGLSFFVFIGLAEQEDVGKFVGLFLFYVPIMSLFVIYPWITILRDGKGKWFMALCIMSAFLGFFAFATIMSAIM